MKDGNSWVAALLRENELLGARILEVRAAYAEQDFEWGQLQRLTCEGLRADNTRLLREFASARFSSMMGSGSGSDTAAQQGQQQQQRDGGGSGEPGGGAGE